MKFVIPIGNQHSYNVIPRNRDLKLDIKYRCNAPSKTLLVDLHGNCFVCACESWLPISVGVITDFERIEDVWASPVAQRLQADIDSGSFDNCAVTRCGVQNYDMLQEEYTISINLDPSCNLRCPSCRSDAIMITSGPVYEERLAMTNHLVDLLEKFDKPCRIIMSGNGDPLASSIMRPLVHRFRPKPNQFIKLFTNGLLLRKQLTDNPVIAHINEYLMSIDAGSKQVYEKVRLGGQWEQLLDNFDFLKEHALPGAQIAITMVIQKDNWRDIENFFQLSVDYGFHGSVTKLEDWGTWPDFDQHDVLNPAHAEYTDAVSELNRCYQKFSNYVGGPLHLAPGLNEYINQSSSSQGNNTRQSVPLRRSISVK
jgi:pyruvate-formate lyase-activating enzyme